MSNDDGLWIGWLGWLVRGGFEVCVWCGVVGVCCLCLGSVCVCWCVLAGGSVRWLVAALCVCGWSVVVVWLVLGVLSFAVVCARFGSLLVGGKSFGRLGAQVPGPQPTPAPGATETVQQRTIEAFERLFGD